MWSFVATIALAPAQMPSLQTYAATSLFAIFAMDAGANVVITGRCVDSAVTLGVLMHEFGWSVDDHDRLAAGSRVATPLPRYREPEDAAAALLEQF
jgi:Acyclic terpene utilisation family protein AtuA